MKCCSCRRRRCRRRRAANIAGRQSAETVRRRACRRVVSLPVGDLQTRRQLFFPLGSAVLEPRLDLYLGKAEQARQIESFADAQVFVMLEFGLQPVQLLGAVRLPRLAIDARFARRAFAGRAFAAGAAAPNRCGRC